jgi:putative DNA primase/helicase
VTGDIVSGCPASVEERSEQLSGLYRRSFPTQTKKIGPGCPIGARSGRGPDVGYPRNLGDGVLLDRARSARNGAVFRALFDNGDVSKYGGDESRAELALCSILAFWTGNDRERIDSLFRQSALMRDKWDRRQDYRDRTIDAAIARVTARWKPRQY